ncbi:hypothetical protein [Arthrobacter sp. SO5]|uniref:hypothetical protein n=1 Tax=Arthrobacter sp. SO5 TaxID=1897055 RepID=UPI001E2C920B|nr:hypothetical protein [Arthrobacter sp. SO5]
MTPATNRPHVPAAASARALTVVRPPSPTVNRGAAAQHTVRGRRDPHPATLAEAEYVGSPFCERCGTDEYIYLETFVPATHHLDGSINRPGEVTYFCSGCDDFSAHPVPASWVPPGWYFG